MSQSANSNSNVQTLKDTADTLIIRCWYYSNNATDESDVQKVNVETLNYRVFQLNTTGAKTNVNQNKFIPGELLTSNTSNSQMYVVEWLPSSNALIVVSAVVGGDCANLANGESVSGKLSNSNIIVGNTSVNAVSIPARLLELESIQWSVTPNTSVELEWKGNGAYTTAGIFTESGYNGRNALQTEIINNSAVVQDGNLYISTHNIGTKGSYTLLLELRKTAGFAQRPVY